MSTDFDHVAMLIKSEKVHDDLFLLEAVSTGVRLLRWGMVKEIIGLEDDKAISHVCYRKVNIERNYEFKMKIYEFARQTIGKPYGASAFKLAFSRFSDPP